MSSSIRRFATAAAKSPLVINKNRILASVILSRSPQITRDATPFERAYFDYKEKLERQNASRFPTEFYFKKGSLAERRWKEEEAARQAAMNDPEKSLTEAVLETQASFQDETSARSNLVQASRVTEADKTNDVKSLDRALQRTLYLVVRQSEGADHWIFPQGQLESNEYLHEAAERYLQHHCGSDMDVWFVGRQPISFYKEAPSRKNDTEGQKVFFMKARIYAGQVKPSNGVSDFAWLTKEELEKYLAPEYYNAIKDSLGDL